MTMEGTGTRLATSLPCQTHTLNIEHCLIAHWLSTQWQTEEAVMTGAVIGDDRLTERSTKQPK